jgi:DNA-binding PadR family transcriptional regulator
MKGHTVSEEMKTMTRDPHLAHDKRIRPSREELMIVLRSLERQGLIVSYLGSDGQVRWRVTEKGKHTKPSGTDDNFYPIT